VLHWLAPRSWRVDADGVTRFGVPPVGVLESSVARGRVDRAAGLVELMADAIAGLVPGVVVEGIAATDVVHTIEAGKLRTAIFGSRSGTTKRLAAHAAIVEALFPALRYAGPWEYRVVFQHGERLDLQPVRASLGMPELVSCAVRPGVAGCRADVRLGSLVHVEFLNQDVARPCVVAFDDADAAGFDPLALSLGAGCDIVTVGAGTETPPPSNPIGRVIRYGDTIALPPPISADYVLVPGTIPLGVSRVRA
jgi:hypothetical protein